MTIKLIKEVEKVGQLVLFNREQVNTVFKLLRGNPPEKICVFVLHL